MPPPEEDEKLLKPPRIECSVAAMWIIGLPKVSVQENFCEFVNFEDKDVLQGLHNFPVVSNTNVYRGVGALKHSSSSLQLL